MTFSKVFTKPFNHTFGLPFSQFSPVDLLGLVLWLDARVGVELDGSNVDRWQDRSLYGNHVGTVNDSVRPIFNATAFNGLPAVQFNGTSQYMEQEGSSASLDLTDSYTSFMVGNITNFSNARHFHSKNFNNGYRWRANGGSGASQIVTNDGSGVQAQMSTDSIAVATDVILSLKLIVGGNIEYRENGVALGAFPTNTLTGIQSGAGKLIIGATNPAAPGEFYAGDMAHQLIFNRLLSKEDENRVGKYLANATGLSWTNII